MQETNDRYRRRALPEPDVPPDIDPVSLDRPAVPLVEPQLSRRNVHQLRDVGDGLVRNPNLAAACREPAVHRIEPEQESEPELRRASPPGQLLQLITGQGQFPISSSSSSATRRPWPPPYIIERAAPIRDLPAWLAAALSRHPERLQRQAASTPGMHPGYTTAVYHRGIDNRGDSDCVDEPAVLRRKPP